MNKRVTMADRSCCCSSIQPAIAFLILDSMNRGSGRCKVVPGSLTRLSHRGYTDDLCISTKIFSWYAAIYIIVPSFCFVYHPGVLRGRNRSVRDRHGAARGRAVCGGCGQPRHGGRGRGGRGVRLRGHKSVPKERQELRAVLGKLLFFRFRSHLIFYGLPPGR